MARIVTADALLPKHQVISIHNTDPMLIFPEQFRNQSLPLIWTKEKKITFKKKISLDRYGLTYVYLIIA